MIGLIGAGSIGGAVITGIVGSGYSAKDIYVKGGKSSRTKALQEKLGFNIVEDIKSLENCEIILIGVGESALGSVLKELESISENKIVIAFTGSTSVSEMKKVITKAKVAHAIPNTPVKIGAGFTGITFSDDFTEDEKKQAFEVLGYTGQVVEVPEEQIGILGTVAGCSPAFLDIFIEALSDAGVKHGLNRKLAYEAAIGMAIGAGKLAMQSDSNVSALKDEVTSPGGSTIRGVAALEEYGFRNAIIKAVDAAEGE
ncbi:pyrroline-5-carboxylate reductase [Lactobacillus terrae]|uniref:pyrroline-5-carboxylate reductase n=1 Tax=Lactobacillus terrae TaxID=2269374 RepID=UPI000C1B743D|nr:pyrroline-5-carboxylate reductase [Lactobacillus terrae]